jgi:hypothetical protein
MVPRSYLTSLLLVVALRYYNLSIVLTMNLNAPEHQPPVAREVAVIGFASEKMFSDPDATIVRRLNQRKKPYIPYLYHLYKSCSFASIEISSFFSTSQLSKRQDSS